MELAGQVNTPPISKVFLRSSKTHPGQLRLRTADAKRQTDFVGPNIAAARQDAAVKGGSISGDGTDRMPDRLDRLETTVAALPNQINQNLMQITQTLSQSITATRQQPLVIVSDPASQPLRSRDIARLKDQDQLPKP